MTWTMAVPMGKVLRRGLVLEIFSRQNASFWLSKIGRIERMQEDSRFQGKIRHSVLNMLILRYI